jgi:abortive infection bacteriophage resistance protein
LYQSNKKGTFALIMGNKALTLDEQIALLRSRNMIITDEDKAKEVLFDVGYYRLGFYWFPFEKTYPQKENRTHEFKEGTNFDDAIKLYYFDFNLRNILHKALARVEIAFRTKVVYLASNFYSDRPTWFMDPTVTDREHIAFFERSIYPHLSKTITVIAQHHRYHINDKYAPAWKTVEFMAFGETIHLYQHLKNDSLRNLISLEFGINKTVIFENYLGLVKSLRNACAHGNILFDFRPNFSIRKGPAIMENLNENQNLNGAIRVVVYLLRQVSVNRCNELIDDINRLIDKYGANLAVKQILTDVSKLKKLNKV